MLPQRKIKEIINLFGNQKIKLIFWILDNLNSENQLIMTQKQIAERTGISIKTVNTVMQELIDSNFLVKINLSAYKLNLEDKGNKKTSKVNRKTIEVKEKTCIINNN